MDLDYPVELHNAHNGYLLGPKKKKIEKKGMSDCQKKMADELGLKQNEFKLVLTLQNKKNSFFTTEVCSLT